MEAYISILPYGEVPLHGRVAHADSAEVDVFPSGRLPELSDRRPSRTLLILHLDHRPIYSTSLFIGSWNRTSSCLLASGLGFLFGGGCLVADTVIVTRLVSLGCTLAGGDGALGAGCLLPRY